MQLYSVEGNRQHLDGGSMYGNVPRALWSRWTPPDAQHRVELSCRALLVTGLNGKTVLFEAGVGAFFDPKLRQRYGVVEDEHVLLKSLEARGLSHEDVDVVVLSHLHFDHAGGLLSRYRPGRDPELLFPRARFLIGERSWRRALDPHPRDRASFSPELAPLLEASGRLQLMSGERCEVLGSAVRFAYSDGHTPGLMLAEIGGAGGVVYCSDLIPGRPWVHLPVSMGYDRYPELLIDEKRAFLEDKLERGVRLFFTHDRDCALADVKRDERGRFSTRNERVSVDELTI